MGTTSDATQATQPERPGLHDGVCGEFTVFVPIKPGQTQALRDTLRHYRTDPSAQKAMREAFDQIGTVHTARYVIFDNDTRLMFASVFDGDWDTYIDDFATTMIADVFDNTFQYTEGYPGIKDPSVKDWFVAHQGPASAFISAYPQLTTKQVLKDQRVNEAFQAVLDTPELRAALENPANAAQLLATPAFQKLLDEAAS
jgi:hypothetical protein